MPRRSSLEYTAAADRHLNGVTPDDARPGEQRALNHADERVDYNGEQTADLRQLDACLNDARETELAESQRLLNEYLDEIAADPELRALSDACRDDPGNAQLLDELDSMTFRKAGQFANNFDSAGMGLEDRTISDRRMLTIEFVNQIGAQAHRTIEAREHADFLSSGDLAQANEIYDRIEVLETQLVDAILAEDGAAANLLWKEMQETVNEYAGAANDAASGLWDDAQETVATYLADDPVAKGAFESIQQILGGIPDENMVKNAAALGGTAASGWAGNFQLGITDADDERRQLDAKTERRLQLERELEQVRGTRASQAAEHALAA